MHYAYIIRSVTYPDKFYYGSTADLKKRIEVHNVGGNTSTRPFRPWALQWYGGFPCKNTAEEFEKYLKTASGKAFCAQTITLTRYHFIYCSYAYSLLVSC